ncbi:hypothetical protein TRVL_01707 [Trypanosoma vivax]|nr:hypothetical protein TRVL_01707 [Trypanosoma vivax]
MVPEEGRQDQRKKNDKGIWFKNCYREEAHETRYRHVGCGEVGVKNEKPVEGTGFVFDCMQNTSVECVGRGEGIVMLHDIVGIIDEGDGVEMKNRRLSMRRHTS